MTTIAHRLIIDDEEAYRVANELVAATGQSVETIVRGALYDELDRIRSRKFDPDAYNKMLAIAARSEALPILDPRTPDEILGYDENGLPS